jgi:hypothetical protein
VRNDQKGRTVHALHRIHAAATRPARRLVRAAEPDRGDSPVPSAIIIGGLALIAVALLAWLGSYVLDFLNEAPTDLPDPPFGE